MHILAPEVAFRGRRQTGARDPVVIGLVNNMPDAALSATEQQFRGLIGAAARDVPIRFRLFYLPELPRGESGRAYVMRHYEPVDALEGARLDGLIVTGAPPRAARMTDEPHWAALERLVDWAKRQTHSTIWSCLAAYAAVLHLDGISRRPLPAKLSGVFDCTVAQPDHPLMAGLAARWSVPHSRHHELPEEALVSNGYRILSRSPVAGADTFVKAARSLFIFFQGHPEYDPRALLREYRRDVRRFLAGESEIFPGTPTAYFDAATEAALAELRERAQTRRDIDLLRLLPDAPSEESLAHRWHRPAIRVYENWLSYLAMRRCGMANPRRPDSRDAIFSDHLQAAFR